MSLRDDFSWINARRFDVAVTTKKAYDITPNMAYHSVNIREQGVFEERCQRLKQPFNPNDYETVELHSGIYRYRKSDLEFYVDDFLLRARHPRFQIHIRNGEYIEGEK